MFGRIGAQVSAQRSSYTPGAISTREQAQAAQAVLKLEERALAIGRDLMTMDEGPHDLNRGVPNNVYTLQSTRAGNQGQAQFNPEGGLTRLRAETYGETVNVTVEGDRKEIYAVSHTDGGGPEQVIQEEWAIFDGGQVSYKKLDYWGRPKSSYLLD
jgi:hypothetical protein